MRIVPCLLLGLSWACGGAVAAGETRKPDVLVILVDQWSPRYLSWDNDQVRTPHLDQIAKEGMIFDSCYTTSPVCMPARISLLTGLYPHNQGHALWGNATGYHVPVAAATMFKDIRDAGWTTAQIGKLHWTAGTSWKGEFEKLPDYYAALSLDKVVDVSGPPDSPKAHDAYARYLTSKKLLEKVAADLRRRYILWEFDPRASVVGPEDYHDTFVTRTAAHFIESQPKDKPLCLVVSLHSPHPPLDAPGEYATMYEPEDLKLPGNVPESFKRENRNINQAEVRRLLANYLGKISLVDHCISLLMEAMKARGTWDNTLVVFTADHGEMMGAHGMLTKGRFYEESARVPLVIRWPGHVKAGRTPALAQMFDVYPTIVDAVGGEVSPGRFAKSLLPVATGQRASVRNIAISEIGDKAPLRMMARNARYKYWADEEREYLFDLQTDPLEMHDLSEDAEHHETLNEMRAALLTHLRSTQTNAAAGYKSKVQRMREAAQEKTPQ